MEEEIESSGTAMMPIALALLAIVLGGAGLYFGLNANQRIAPLIESVDEGTSSAARLDKQLASIETRIAEVTAQSDELKKTVDRLRIYGSQSETLTKQVAAGVKSNREEIVTLAEKMKELAGSRVRAPVPVATSTASKPDLPTSGTATAATSSAVPTSGTGSASIYKIQSGDTFGKIASLKGVSLDALLAANPDADPRRLRIGQEIKIPAQ
jgi:LysM repeat protein